MTTRLTVNKFTMLVRSIKLLLLKEEEEGEEDEEWLDQYQAQYYSVCGVYSHLLPSIWVSSGFPVAFHMQKHVALAESSMLICP